MFYLHMLAPKVLGSRPVNLEHQVKQHHEPDKEDGCLKGFNITAVLAKMADRSVLLAQKDDEKVALTLRRIWATRECYRRAFSCSVHAHGCMCRCDMWPNNLFASFCIFVIEASWVLATDRRVLRTAGNQFWKNTGNPKLVSLNGNR